MSTPSPTALPSPHAVLGSLTAAFRSRESLSSSSSLPRSPASSASLPSLTDAGSSSSSCSSLSSLSTQSPAPNEHLAVFLPRNLWKKDIDATHCDIFLCRKPFTLMERRHVCASTFTCTWASRSKPFCSIAESAVISFAVPAPRILHPSSTRQRFRLFTLRVVHPSLLTRPQPRLFSLPACVTRATPKSTALLPLTRLPHPHRLQRRHYLHPVLLAALRRAVHELSLHHRLRILRFRMTCVAIRFGSVPIFVRLRVGAGGCQSHRLFLTT